MKNCPQQHQCPQAFNFAGSCLYFEPEGEISNCLLASAQSPSELHKVRVEAAMAVLTGGRA